MPKEPEYLSQFERLEDERRRLLFDLSQWPTAHLNFRPAPGTWSVVEVLDHVVRAEAGTIADVRKGLDIPHALGSEDRPGITALRRALLSDNTFQVPAGAGAIIPDAQTTFAEVINRWEEARRELRSILETLDPAQLGCGVFQHPFAGWMTVTDVLDHLSDHLHHHRFQLSRLQASCGALMP
jgi:uncharacterized damage-inducible protein DinB